MRSCLGLKLGCPSTSRADPVFSRGRFFCFRVVASLDELVQTVYIGGVALPPCHSVGLTRAYLASLSRPHRGRFAFSISRERIGNISRRREMLNVASTWASSSNLALQQGPQHRRLPFKRDLNPAAHALRGTSDAPPTP